MSSGGTLCSHNGIASHSSTMISALQTCLVTSTPIPALLPFARSLTVPGSVVRFQHATSLYAFPSPSRNCTPPRPRYPHGAPTYGVNISCFTLTMKPPIIRKDSSKCPNLMTLLRYISSCALLIASKLRPFTSQVPRIVSLMLYLISSSTGFIASYRMRTSNPRPSQSKTENTSSESQGV